MDWTKAFCGVIAVVLALGLTRIMFVQERTAHELYSLRMFLIADRIKRKQEESNK